MNREVVREMANVKAGLGGDLAKFFIATRLKLSGEGGLSSVPYGDGEEVERVDEFTLPGAGDRVRFDPSGKKAQMFYPNGKPLSGSLDIEDPGAFASLMHNVDASVMTEKRARGGGPTRTDFPVEALELSDAALTSTDVELAESVKGAFRAHPLPENPTPRKWQAPKLLRILIDEARASSDPAVSREASKVERLSFAPEDGRRYGDDRSIARWGWLAEKLAVSAAGREPREIGSDGNLAWREVVTTAGFEAAGREIGKRFDGRSLSALERFDGSGMAMDGHEGFVLEDGWGQTVAFYARNGGDPVLGAVEGRSPARDGMVLKALQNLSADLEAHESVPSMN